MGCVGIIRLVIYWRICYNMGGLLFDYEIKTEVTYGLQNRG